ncbi:hypothetical protein [Rhodopseudomonas parapalustris]
MISQENLDKRICDVEEGAENTQTYYEYIIETEKEFNIIHAPIHQMNDEELKDYLELLDSLYDK